jgi:hypothetical protein
MDKKLDIRVVALPIDDYDREWLDTKSDQELSEIACADGNSDIY